MSNDKMQEEFEQAISLAAGEPILSIYLSRRNDTYSTSTLHYAWWAWKASRATVVVELPSLQCLKINDCDAEQARAYCRSAIEAVGLKVAP